MVGAPQKIRLIPDGFHIHNVGRLSDGRLFLVDTQLEFVNGVTRDFVCTFIFNADRHLTDQSIELLGDRGSYAKDKVGEAIDRHLAALGDHTVADIRIRPFSVESHGVVFGFIPRTLKGGGWRVEFMPGNTLSFHAPWEAGGYDT